MNRTKIEWTDYTWNPIKGLCPVGCWYCYARRMHKRFRWNERLRLDLSDFGDFASWNPDAGPDKPSKIFVCSTIEMFHADVPSGWRDGIFSLIESNPQHTFQILTKLPQNIDREMPENVWLGVSITKEEKKHKIVYLDEALAKVKFVSFEPLLGHIKLKEAWIEFSGLDWVIIGKLTGYGHKYDPKVTWIDFLVSHAKTAKKPIFLKDNLREIYGEPLEQEFPPGGK